MTQILINKEYIHKNVEWSLDGILYSSENAWTTVSCIKNTL